jgi:hypothetical protein
MLSPIRVYWRHVTLSRRPASGMSAVALSKAVTQCRRRTRVGSRCGSEVLISQRPKLRARSARRSQFPSV